MSARSPPGYEGSTQILLIGACPLPGPIPGLTAWTMTRVFTFAGSGYRLLMAGLGILLAMVLAAAALLARLTMRWPRHIGQIEATLQTHDIAALPILPTTGERELDRIVVALNEAGGRLADARGRAERNGAATGVRRTAGGDRPSGRGFGA